MVLIKPLRAALRDGDIIRAVIRSTSANQDGRTPGITQPSSEAQQNMIRNAYESAGLDLSCTRFFEAHGTGTAVGDPIEAEAINTVFGQQRTKDQPLYVGAVKSNIGHCEGASGLAGLIKTILVLEKATIPPNTLFERGNPKIPLNDWNIEFPVEPVPWPTYGLRRASVSSFGFGGANAHVVLDDAFNYLRLREWKGRHKTREIPPPPTEFGSAPSGLHERLCGQSLEQRHTRASKLPKLLLWSALDDNALQQMLLRFAQYIAYVECSFDRHDFLEELTSTLSTRRTHLPCRTYVVASSENELPALLEQGVAQLNRTTGASKLGFVFTGQGAQWPLMGVELLVYPVFRRSLELATQHLHGRGCEWDVISEISHDSKSKSNLNDPIYSQPICTILQIALVDLLADWGILPATVIGFSSGEIAAAYCTGAICRESAWDIAFYRGIMSALSKRLTNVPLAMMAVGTNETKFQSYWKKTESAGGLVTIACYNSPKSITISGCERRIDAIKLALHNDSIFARKLAVDVAYHTAYMENVASMYEELIGDIRPMEPPLVTPTMFSSVTGARVAIEHLQHRNYWVENMISPVRFMQAASHALGAGSSKQSESAVDHLLEIGPHCTLRGPLKQICDFYNATGSIGYSSILRRGAPAMQTTLEAMGQLFCKGFTVDFTKVNLSFAKYIDRCMLIDLPSYPWNHAGKYWLESRISKNYRLRKVPHHQLLGTPVPDWNPLEPKWRHTIRSSEIPWIRDHKVFPPPLIMPLFCLHCIKRCITYQTLIIR